MIECTEDGLRSALKEREREPFFLYLYTPMCGTCMVASKMLTVVEAMHNNVSIGKMDLNYAPQLAEEYKIESVPCLLIFQEGQLTEKIYRFESVPHLLEKMSS
ncbi:MULTISPECIES: thioredoxin family protein [Bacillaceae]|uniref:thioredoxin family protein n=1 Tax=Bacillaceae TaxID=186817 RepID=UPI001E4923C6|nr:MULTISPECIES: thioredoxin family protein [Bacillaceae]MCE4050251.1 thioredoxin family protein [Bacillus sp. Au-Bac7]MDL0435208.1 thioredoxin family protein [Niallia sp. SS-2023]UPO87027.1 thioredoxin family protein [Niallia sp. Man26]